MSSFQSVALPNVSESGDARTLTAGRHRLISSRQASVESRRSALGNHAPLILALVVLLSIVLTLRWNLVSDVSWQCDEIPLLVRTTGLCGVVSDERQAASFRPSLFSFSRGTIRALRPPKYLSSIHTSTSVWTNLTVHLFGCTPAAGRLGPYLFSIALIATSGWLAWMWFGNGWAVGLAMAMAALSPAATAYAAQVRGYAESMALAPLLLVFLEWFRRNPRSIARILLILIFALQLSLTVYTTWLYWVLPVMIGAVWRLPGHVSVPMDRRLARWRLGLGFLILLAVMAVYTWFRLDHLTRTASSFGRPIQSFQDAINAVGSVLGVFTPVGAWLFLPILIGTAFIWRSSGRWWLEVVALAAATPLLFATWWGSWGYDRNLLFWLGISSVLAGGGMAGLVHWLAKIEAQSILRWLPAAGVTALGVAWLPGLQERAEALLPPDWGGMVRTLSLESETKGPRWILECPTNHWQINWYRPSPRPAVLRSILSGRRAEVVATAQAGEDGQPVFYQADPDRKTIVARPVPEFLAGVPFERRFRGLRQWRWSTEPFDDSPDPATSGEILFAVVLERNGENGKGFSGAWERLAGDCGALLFRPFRAGPSTIRALLVAGERFAELRGRLNDVARVGGVESVKWFRLSSVSSFAPISSWVP